MLSLIESLALTLLEGHVRLHERTLRFDVTHNEAAEGGGGEGGKWTEANAAVGRDSGGGTCSWSGASRSQRKLVHPRA